MRPAFLSAFLNGQFVNALLTILITGWPLAVAYWLLRGAPGLVGIAYPESPEGAVTESGGFRGDGLEGRGTVER